MGEGESKDNNNNSNNNVGEKKKQPEQKGKKEDSNYVNVVVLKVDVHCKGCANKIIRFLNSFDGVEKIKVEMDANKLTVEGKVDPSHIREKLQEKIKKKVEILSPQPKKDKENKGGGDNNSSSNNNNNKNDDSKKKDQEKKSEDKKPKEPPVTTITVKVVLHCEGCILKIQKAISKIRGLQSMSIEREKDLITVTGTIDAKALVDTLKGKIKRTVEIVPLKKEEKKDTPKKDNAGGGGGGGGGGGQGKDSKVGDGIGTGGGGGEGKKGGGGGGGKEGENKKNENKKNEKMEGNKSEYFGPMPTFANYGYFGPTPTFANYGNMSYGYTYGHMYGDPSHAPQLFSDENPNACSVM